MRSYRERTEYERDAEKLPEGVRGAFLPASSGFDALEESTQE